MTVKQAAELLKVSTEFIRQSLKSGWLPIGTAVLLPSGKYRYYINAESVKEFTRKDLEK